MKAFLTGICTTLILIYSVPMCINAEQVTEYENEVSQSSTQEVIATQNEENLLNENEAIMGAVWEKLDTLLTDSETYKQVYSGTKQSLTKRNEWLYWFSWGAVILFVVLFVGSFFFKT